MGEGLKRARKAAKATQKPERRWVDFSRPGRMISGTKSGPPGHICVFNANVCLKSAGKIWFGDLDLTADTEDLKRLAAVKVEDVYVLREMDCRFESQASPRYENAVAIIKPSGEIQINK